jgi:hypothetical protein
MTIIQSSIARTVLTLVLLICTQSAYAEEQSATQALSEALAQLDEANTLAASDASQAVPMYKEAAAQLELVRDTYELHNAELEHALANAYLKAGERGHAVLAYRRALLLDPTNRPIIESLLSTRAQVGSQIQSSRTHRVIALLLSWRGSIPRTAAWTSATICFLLAWVCIALRIYAGVRPLATAAVICMLGSLLLFGSLGLDHWESRSLTSGVLVEPSVTARTGPSARIFDPAFQQPLTAGVEFVVVEQRDGWSKVQLASNALCWVPNETIGLINPTE